MDQIETSRLLIDLFNARDLQAILPYMHDDFTWIDHAKKKTIVKDDVTDYMDWWISLIAAQVTETKYYHCAEQDRVYIEFVASGHHNGQVVNLNMIVVHEYKDGLLDHAQIYYDGMNLIYQALLTT